MTLSATTRSSLLFLPAYSLRRTLSSPRTRGAQSRPCLTCSSAQILTASMRCFCSAAESMLEPWRKIQTHDWFRLSPYTRRLRSHRDGGHQADQDDSVPYKEQGDVCLEVKGGHHH